MKYFFDISLHAYLRFKFENWVAKVQCEGTPLIDRQLLAKLTSLLLTIEYLKIVWPIWVFKIARFVSLVDGNSYHVFLHFRHKLLNVLIGHSQVRIGVDLDEPHPKVFIYKEIKAE